MWKLSLYSFIESQLGENSMFNTSEDVKTKKTPSLYKRFSSVQLLSHVQLFATCPSGCPVHHELLEFTQTHVHWISDAIQPSHPMSLPSPASIFPSIRVFSNESVLRIRWPKYWSSSFSISPSNEYSGLISFRMDPLDLLAVQGTLKSLLQHHSSEASIFGAQLFFF